LDLCYGVQLPDDALVAHGEMSLGCREVPPLCQLDQLAHLRVSGEINAEMAKLGSRKKGLVKLTTKPPSS
jgi:hypothetical protein